MRAKVTRTVGAVLASCLVLAACALPSEQARTTEPDAQGGTPSEPNADDGERPETTVPPTTRAPRRFTLAASGDILLHNNVIQSGKSYAKGNGYEFGPMFDDVRDLISSADLALCHMETPISADNTNLTVPRTLSFNAPREIATGIKGAGFDGCDTASNHTYDRQLRGVKETLDVLDQAGLKHSGSSRDQAEADRPPIYEVNGIKVGHLAYSYTIYNDGGPSTTVPTEAPWLKSMLWPALTATGITEQARRLRAQGAEFVVVSMHWGDQYVQAPNKQQRQLARDLLSAPEVDLILGDHVHVVQPCEKIGDKYVAYGMGNFLSNQSPSQDRSLRADNQDGSLDTFTVDETAPGVLKVTKMQFAPTWVEIPGHRIRRATPGAFPDSYKRTVSAMGALGPGACDASPAY